MSQIYCSNCGQLIRQNSNFCQFCGAPQHGKEARFRISDPEVEKPALVTNIPKQAKRNEIDYIPKSHLGADSIIFFFLSVFAKGSLIFVLLIVGAIVEPFPFAFGVIAYVIVVLMIAVLIYNNFTFKIDQDGLKIESGVIHRLHVSVPFEQIQNVNVERTLLDRILGFARVSIETAGQASTPSNGSITKARSEAYLPGLHLKRAQEIHDLLVDGADGSIED